MNDLHLRDRFAAQPFGDPMRAAVPAHHHGLTADRGEFHVYLSETDAGYTLKAALPCACKEDISVRIDHATMTATNTQNVVYSYRVSDDLGAQSSARQVTLSSAP